MVPTYTPRNPTLTEHWECNYDPLCEPYLHPDTYVDIEDIPQDLEALVLAEARLEPLFVLQTISYGLEVPVFEQTFKESLWLLAILLLDGTPDEPESIYEKISLDAAPYWAYSASCDLIHAFKTGDLKIRALINRCLDTETFVEGFWEICYPIFSSRLIALRKMQLEYYSE
tara:strand:- start:1381 stop:1893 length:513 start_codon:yes stop_codon:yes gene_type:complete